MAYNLSKLFWVFLAPGNFLILLLLLGAFLAMSHIEARRNFGRKLCFDIAFLLFFFGIFPVGDWMLVPLENRFPPEVPAHIDGIVLLGSDEIPRISQQRGIPTMYEGSSLLMEVAALSKRYPQARLAYTGGSALIPPDPHDANAEVTKEALASIGVPVARMMFEGASRNTHENAMMAKQLVQPQPEQNWLLVTSAYHMPRSMAAFRAAGWNVYPAPTYYLTGGQLSTRLQFNLALHLQEMSIAMHEYYGLLAYRLLGYTDKLWPAP